MPNVAAIILAAGGSSRLRRPKQLVAWHGESLVRRAFRAAAEAGCNPVVVVVGENSEAIRAELKSTSAVVVENPQWQRGLGTSIRRGLETIADRVDAAALLTCDQPLVDAKVIISLLSTRETTGKPIVASRYAGTLGVPALFGRSCFQSLLALPDNSGAKSLIEERAPEVASIEFEEGTVDIDTPEDFKRLNEMRG